MAGELSYTITRKNNQTEKQGIELLLQKDPCFWSIDKETRKEIMSILKIDKKYSRAFDLIYVHDSENSKNLQLKPGMDFTLIELKTTKKYLPGLPNGFFFGATENEFELARSLGDRYKFCFVSLHEDSKLFSLISLEELEARIKTKRVQYQINL